MGHRSQIGLVIAAMSIAMIGTRALADDTGLLNGSAPASQPANGLPDKSPEELQAEFENTSRQLGAMIPPAVLSDADKRNQIAPHAIPIIYHRMDLTEQLAATKMLAPLMVIKMRSLSQALLYLLQDQRTVARVNSMMSSADPGRKLTGQIIGVYADWLGAGNDKGKQATAVDEIEKLDKANPIEIRLTQLTLTMSETTTHPEIEQRLLHLVLDVMHDRYSVTQKVAIKSELDSQAKMQPFLDKPITITGKTVEGDDFSSSNWAGKVVLVDFWATWCAPCRAELPRIVQYYNQYHAQGLEIVGVSSDSSSKQVQDFLSQNNYPWTHLFDASTTTGKLHPMCGQFGVTTLPAIFLIDKQGILRSVNGWKQMDEMIPQLLAESDPTTRKSN